MQTTAATPETFFETLPEDRQAAMNELRKTIKENLPKGFEERIGGGMLNYVVPHSKYAPGYHCNPSQPLPFVSVASQKNFIAVYHMGLYADPKMLEWFTNEYPKHSKTKLDMGKSCIRFKKPAEIPYALLADLFSRMSADQWINTYESILKR